LADAEKLLSTLTSALGRDDITFNQYEDAKVTVAVLPTNGIAVESLPELITKIIGSGSDQTTKLLDFDLMGFKPAPKTDDPTTTLSGLYLTDFAFAELDDGHETSLGLAWYGANWTVLPKILTLSAPAAAISYTTTDGGDLTIGASIQGHATLLGAIELDCVVTRTWGEDAEPAQFSAALSEGSVIHASSLLDAFGMAELPGLSKLTISHLDVIATPSDHVANIEFTIPIGWSPGWGNGAFELKNTYVVIGIEDGSTEAKIKATAELFGVEIELTADEIGSDWSFGLSADLVDTDLSDVVDDLGTCFGLGHLGDLLGDFGHFNVSHVGASIQLSTHQMRFSLTSDGDWHVPWCDGIIISDMHFDVEHGGDTDGTTTLQAGGTLSIGDGIPPLDVEVDYGGRDEGLTFSAKLADGIQPTLDKFKFPAGLSSVADIFPIDASKFKLTAFEMSFNTKTKVIEIKFSGDLTLNMAMAFDFDITMTPVAEDDPDGGFEKHFGGEVTLGVEFDDDGKPKPDTGMTFDLIFDAKAESENFIAVYRNPAGKMTSLKPILASVMGPHGAPDVRFVVRDAILTASRLKKSDDFGHILALSIDAGADLSKLPIVGQALPADEAIMLGFKPLATNRDIPTEELAALNALLPDGVVPFGGKNADPIKDRFQMSTHLTLGSFEIDLDQPLTMIEGKKHADGDEASFDIEHVKVPPTDKARKPPPPEDPIHWKKIQKSFGPLSIARIGLGFDLPQMTAKAVVDASIGGGGLTLTAMGLGATYNISTKKLGFALDGLGLAYANGPTSISGALLQLKKGEYVGEAMIHTATFGLSALGAYSDTDNFKSLFVYAFLDYPIGGPPFAFVEGAAIGFGYNRRVRDIGVDEIREFPFVKEAIAPSSTPPQPPKTPAEAQEALLEEMRGLDSWVTPVEGEYFLAAGIKFNSFRIVDSFALAIVTFGDRFRVDILGTSTIVLPPAPPEATAEEKANEPKLAVIDMSMDAKFHPDEGLLGVDATLGDTSWFLSKACTLKGGFAFCSWFSGPHSGDFVTSLGGYYPNFKIPDHYPRPRRLELTWHVSDFVEIKGNAYFALTPNAMMAGGHYDATWSVGNLWASFSVGADFLMQWKPFHYEGQVSVEISAGYGSLSGSIGASVELFGPEFSGTAHFKFLMVSFDVDFGADKPTVKAIPWGEFKTSFLPADKDKIVTVSPTHGVMRTIPAAKAPDAEPQAASRVAPIAAMSAAAMPPDAESHLMAMAAMASAPIDDGPTYVVNPKELQIATSSLVPASELAWTNPPESGDKHINVDGVNADFGVAPMNLKAITSAKHHISITLNGNPVEHRFRMAGQTKPFAAAMWGVNGQTPDMGADAVANVLGAAQISPLKPVTAGQTTAIPRKNVKFDPFLVLIDHQKEPPQTPPSQDLSKTQSKGAIAAHLATRKSRKNRQTMAGFLGVQLPVGTPSVTSALARDMTFAPRCAKLIAKPETVQ